MGKSSKEKKRSKNGEKQEKPVEVKIKTIGENPENKTSPIVGYFPSGYNPSNNSDESSVKVYKSVNKRNPRNPRMQVVVGAGGSQVSFVGTNYSGEATAPQLCNYALGVFDKESCVLKMVPIAANRVKNCVLKMVPIAANRIFRLEPRVGSVLEQELQEEPKEEVTMEDKTTKLRTLAKMYSSKKDVNRDVKRDALRQTEVPGMQEEMDQKLKGIKINKEALEDIESIANSRNIPPYDLAATVAVLAYPLDKIILKGEWEYLLDVFELAQAGSEADPELYPSFVCNRFHKLEHVKDESEKKRMSGILSYITHLIKFKDKHSMDGVSSAKNHKLPSILAQKFSSMFGSTNDKRRIPEEKQKLLISYVLVLSLFADNFRSDPSDIAKDLRMSAVTLRIHYEYLGCKFVRDNGVLLATLPVPLEFQTLKRKRRR